MGSRQRCSQGLGAGTGLSIGMEQVLVSWRQFRDGGGGEETPSAGAKVRRGLRVSPASSLHPPAAPACERVTQSAAWQLLSPAALCWPHGHRPGIVSRPPAPGETKAMVRVGGRTTWAEVGGTETLGGIGVGFHLGLGLLSGAPPPLLLLAGSWGGLGGWVLRGHLGAHPQVLAALYIL